MLKGGDHGSKTAAQRRFRRPDGPNVLVCTAAGREGINLQFARILFNFDLPWNPMDLEQRIGRIHRYGQRDTAQVYNFVTTDTIEGNIFLLLDEKLQEIALTLGKVDENGEPAEDFRVQVLGQLNTRLNYEKLYQEALADPTLKRTRQEIEVAMTNAERAQQVVFELFQDLEKFNLQDYRRVDDGGIAMRRLLDFSRSAVAANGGTWTAKTDDEFEASLNGSGNIHSDDQPRPGHAAGKSRIAWLGATIHSRPHGKDAVASCFRTRADCCQRSTARRLPHILGGDGSRQERPLETIHRETCHRQHRHAQRRAGIIAAGSASRPASQPRRAI